MTLDSTKYYDSVLLVLVLVLLGIHIVFPFPPFIFLFFFRTVSNKLNLENKS